MVPCVQSWKVCDWATLLTHQWSGVDWQKQLEYIELTVPQCIQFVNLPLGCTHTCRETAQCWTPWITRAGDAGDSAYTADERGSNLHGIEAEAA
ncbi:hypothetical protein WJX72_011304 [[Myrmecia] bisecta]|uniref:Uncharacterized protein n=1 Tax=[Myrmecia] bisecta TaxID=41462 RepID=A0AAW1R9V5_9CHLO